MTRKFMVVLVAALVVLTLTAGLVSLGGAWFSKGQLNEAGEKRIGSIVEPDRASSGQYKIYDHCYQDLAISVTRQSLYARPLEIQDIEGVASLVGERLGLDPGELSRSLKSERSFVWLGRLLSPEKAEGVLGNGLSGIHAVAETQRIYPARRIGAHVVGFVEDDNGLAGVELSYDHLLRRVSGEAGNSDDEMHGHLQLALDLRIQDLLAQVLGELRHETGASAGTGIVMDYRSGAVRAMVSLPDYDPNSYWDVGQDGHLNRAVNASLVPGGFISLFDLAVIYEKKGSGDQNSLASLKMDLLFDNLPRQKDSGPWFEEQGNEFLSPELRGWPENVGIGGDQAGLTYRFGLSGKSGIDLPESEDVGKDRSGGTTPIKLLTAISVLINGGKKIVPHVAEAVIDPDTGSRRFIAGHDGNIEELLTAPASRKIVELLSARSRSTTDAVFLESMSFAEPDEPGDEEIIASGEFQARYRTVLVGFDPDSDSGLALLVSLESAAVDPAKKTPMRKLAETTLERMVELAVEKIVMPEPEVIAAREKKIVEAWLGSQAYDRLVAVSVKKKSVTAKKPDLMPDLHGLSLRKALRTLQPFEARVEVAGSGRVIDQEPAAGSVFSGGECRLSLRSDF